MTEATQIESATNQAHTHYGRALAATVMTGLAFASAPAQATEAAPLAGSSGLGDCAPYFSSKYQNHEYEVCTAYAANASQVALRGMYKYGNNRVSYLKGPATGHFETRYKEQARDTIERDVSSWPKTSSLLGNKVKGSVNVLSISANLRADRALLRTRESWNVTSRNGNTLHREPEHTKNITMCRGRLPGHVLHEWFVVRFDRTPGYDCKAFDKRNGITP